MRYRISVGILFVVIVVGAGPGMPVHRASAQVTATQSDARTIDALLRQVQQLQAQLQALTAQSAAGSATPVFTRTLGYGSTGPDVTELQRFLAERGYLHLDSFTQYFGDQTLAALTQFQQDNNLPPVGVLGPRTRALVNSLMQSTQGNTSGGNSSNQGTSTAAPANNAPSAGNAALAPSCATDTSGTPIVGYAWSENVGWIDLSCRNTNACAASNFGLYIANNGTVSGCAWSENVGWVSASSNDLAYCPQGTCSSTVSATAWTGWLRALAPIGHPQAGGWDGWISLSGAASDGARSPYGIAINNGVMSGFGWGSTVVGWTDFSLARIGASAQPPTASITAVPTLVRSGNTSSISWTSANARNCSVSGTNGDFWTGVSGTQTSGAIRSTTIYTLTCLTDSGAAVTRSVTVNILPMTREI